MKHKLTVHYDDETQLVTISPESLLVNRGLCYLMLGMAHEIVIRNGLSAPAFKPSNEGSPQGRLGVQPVNIRITEPEE